MRRRVGDTLLNARHGPSDRELSLEFMTHGRYHARMDQNEFFGPVDSSPERAAPVRMLNRQAELGQYMTPPEVASFMASIFDEAPGEVTLLDAGAGQASLTSAFVRRFHDSRIEAHAYEIDDIMVQRLRLALSTLSAKSEVFEGDFLERAAHMIALNKGPRYTHAILNPPYGKIGVSSKHRAWCRAAGLEAVNLYAGFVGLSLKLMKPGGQLVAIIPRSFANGPYYKPFRKMILRDASIRRIHLFGSRNSAFKEDAVLQENVIIHLVRGRAQDDVTVSTSTDRSFSDLVETTFPFSEIVRPEDREAFIHMPDGSPDDGLIHRVPLADIGMKVSTGPIVDFRVREHLHDDPAPGDAPLLYPGHFIKGTLTWPRASFRKPNAIARNAATERWLYPSGHYVIVKRFSSKEEKRRIVAYLVDPDELDGYGGAIGFENHWNVFHANRRPIDELEARGLTTYLNGSAFDRAFRRFNGHTQVNATDLRNMTYPSRENLLRLGEWALHNPNATTEEIDREIEKSV